MDLSSAFFNQDENRLRSGWRILIQSLLLIFFGVLMAFLFGDLPSAVWLGSAVLLSVFVAAQILDKKKLRWYGLVVNAKWLRELAYGTALGFLVIAVIYLVLILTGAATFNGFGWNRTGTGSFHAQIGIFLATMAFVAFYEELWIRGYVFMNLRDGLHKLNAGLENRYVAGLYAAGISGIFFGILHAGNPNATLLSTTNIAIAGIMLAIPVVYTNSLGLVTGLHFGWNFFLGGFFGLPVSGLNVRQSVIQTSVSGPDWWSGGVFGPEGGLIGTIVLISLIVGFMAYFRVRTEEN